MIPEVEKFFRRKTASGCRTYPRNGRVSSSEAGHAVRIRAFGE